MIYRFIDFYIDIIMKFSFVKRINVTKNSIFYSMMHQEGKIIAFGRRYYGNEKYLSVTMDITVIMNTEEGLLGIN